MKDVLLWLVKFIGYYAVALMIAAVIFLPVIIDTFWDGQISGRELCAAFV